MTEDAPCKIDKRFVVQRVDDFQPVMLSLYDPSDGSNFYTGLLGEETARELGHALLYAADGSALQGARVTSAMRAAQPAMLVLRSGDKVLVTLAEEPDPEAAAHVLEGLRKHFPGVDFMVATGISGIAVLP